MNPQGSVLYRRMAELREEKGWSQQELADRIGVTRQTCCNYESRNRRPDCDILARMCAVFDVSADYLLGLSDTKKPEYAEIAKTTGLSQEAIDFLNSAIVSQRELVTCLLEEEPAAPPWGYGEPDPHQEAMWSDPAYIEQKYQEHLRQAAWEEEMARTPILEHVANDWAFQDHISSQTEEDMIAEAQVDRQAAEAYYSQVDPASFGPIDDQSLEASKKRMEREWAYKAAEAKKSNLLSAIAAYVAYTGGCTIETMFMSETLTDLHAINIGTGRGNTITFPSDQGNELIEFMLLQKVIDALKSFKANRYK